MDILQLGAKLLKDQLGSSGNLDGIAQALGQLLGAKNGQVDLAGLIGKLASNGGVQNALKSVLGGNGAGTAITPAQIVEMFGSGKLGSFAQQLGVHPDTAAGGLAAVLPKLLEQTGDGGSLLQQGLGGLLGGKKLF